MTKRFDFPPSFDLAVLPPMVAPDDESRLMTGIIEQLWMKDRTLVSDGYRESLDYLGGLMPLRESKVASGTEMWTWKAPQKWSVREAWIRSGDRVIADYRAHPLHLASYSVPFSGRLSKAELLPHLHANPDRRNAAPFLYHYYRPDWSFCVSAKTLESLGDGPFDVKVDTVLADDHLRVGEIVVKGDGPDSVVLTSHLCHPGQANDGLSGVAVGVALMKRIAALPRRRYTYRLVLGPENIGSIAWLFANQDLIPSLRFGVVLEMLGNKNHLKLQYSRQGNTALDRIADKVLSETVPVYGVGPFRQVICNDEINFNGPGIDAPTISLSRWPYPEYHTTDDSPDIISPRYMMESLDVCWRILRHLEANRYPSRRYTGNVFLSKYGLYEDLNLDDTIERIVLAFDGRRSVLDIAEDLGLPLSRVEQYAERFKAAGLVDLHETPQA